MRARKREHVVGGVGREHEGVGVALEQRGA